MEVSSKEVPHGGSDDSVDAKDDDSGKEVFHLPDNKYTYQEAHDACNPLTLVLLHMMGRTCI